MKENWKKVKLERFFTVKKGQAITKRESNPGPYPVILGGREPAYYIDRYNHDGKSIVVSRSGASAGYVSFWNEPIFITDGFLIEPKSDVCYEYVYYLMKNNESRFIGSQKGAAIPHVTPALLYDVEAFLPPLSTQQKIASILSAYDDLIENNRKQIKLLEEAAQRLYKEWFVDLRFPGYENTPIVDGVPEGWRIGTLGEIGEFKRGKTITKDTTIKGNIPVVAGGLEPAYYHNESNTESPVITVSGSGANAGFTRMYNEKIWASDCSFLDYSKCKVLNFVYCILKSSSAIVDNLQKGAAQPHVYAKDINALEILLPNNKLIEKFECIINPYFFKIKNCQLEIKNAQQARDKLLPRLMSGEMEV